MHMNKAIDTFSFGLLAPRPHVNVISRQAFLPLIWLTGVHARKVIKEKNRGQQDYCYVHGFFARVTGGSGSGLWK